MVPFRVLSRTNLAYRSHHSGLNPRPVKLLQPLVPLQKSQLLWNQTNPASFCKTSGVGGTPSARYRPGTSLTEWTGSIPDTAELWQLRVKQAHAMENEQCYGRKTSLCL